MQSTDNDDFAGRVRALLKAQGLSQSELARRMDASPQALQQILYASNPKMETLQRIAKALGCEPGELVP